MSLTDFDYALDYPYVSFVLAVSIFIAAMFTFHWLIRLRDLPPLFGYTFLLLTLVGVIGAWGRWTNMELTVEGDHTIRVVLVGLRLAIIVTLALDALWLWRRLRQEDH